VTGLQLREQTIIQPRGSARETLSKGPLYAYLGMPIICRWSVVLSSRGSVGWNLQSTHGPTRGFRFAFARSLIWLTQLASRQSTNTPCSGKG
jgi:hypothetical protein